MINVLAVRVSIKFNLEEFLSNFVVLNCLQNRSAVYYNILVRKNRKVRCQRCKEELSGLITTKVMALLIIQMVKIFLFTIPLLSKMVIKHCLKVKLLYLIL